MYTFFRHGINATEKVSLFDGDDSLGGALVTKFDTASGPVWLCNVHGLPAPGSKLDSPERLRQSKKIIDYLADKPGAKIVMGDFNLMPQTESVRMFESTGYSNLIKDFSIRSTRNHYAWDRFPDSKQLFADYTFVSPEVRVKNFSVLNDNVSDHLAMQLEIN
jgi:endonuclease/exonuclease/phosphatase family metal-dependent hydrolase